jgi:hypothetical protein
MHVEAKKVVKAAMEDEKITKEQGEEILKRMELREDRGFQMGPRGKHGRGGMRGSMR